jgi:SAM-dependent methyltransferase
MPAQSFDDLTDVYDALIDWPKRLANEEPFYRWLFGRVGAQRILDAACGTGRHAAMFNAWGLEVEGADLSPAMIERARSQFGESSTLRWAVRGFDQPASTPLPFDVALCVGNSLALAPDRQSVAAAVRGMLSAVRPGGAILIHILNLWALADGVANWQKCQRTTLPAGECLIIKGVRRCGQGGFVDLLVTRLDAAPPLLRSECVPFLGLEAAELVSMAREAGARRVEVFGNYRREVYAPSQSQDVILVASR